MSIALAVIFLVVGALKGFTFPIVAAVLICVACHDVNILAHNLEKIVRACRSIVSSPIKPTAPSSDAATIQSLQDQISVLNLKVGFMKSPKAEDKA